MKYLEYNDKELYSAFDDLCLQYLLRPQRNSSGVTLIIPKEKAYRQKIINGLSSQTPEVAIAMLKSLVLKDYYPTPSSFGTSVVNLLGQKVPIDGTSDSSVKLDKSLTLTKDKKFVPLSRENMAVYLLTGKGEISTSNPMAPIIKNENKRGGSEESSSSKETLQNYLKDIYLTEMGKVDNIYVKKVYFQLRYIKYGDPDFITGGSTDNENVTCYLGNDEFSDSYLLDMYCSKYLPQCFDALLKLFKPEVEIPEFSEKIIKATKQKYILIKAEIIEDDKTLKGDSNDYSNRVNGIQGPIDVRTRVHEYYGDDKDRLGKDLFIVFSNLSRDLWNTEPTVEDRIDSFKNYANLTTSVFTCCKDMLNTEFDVARDLTIYGNLLKSDVFKFVPKASFDNESLQIPANLPSPLDMKLYSLSGFINKPQTVDISGGSSKYAYLLEDL